MVLNIISHLHRNPSNFLRFLLARVMKIRSKLIIKTIMPIWVNNHFRAIDGYRHWYLLLDFGHEPSILAFNHVALVNGCKIQYRHTNIICNGYCLTTNVSRRFTIAIKDSIIMLIFDASISILQWVIIREQNIRDVVVLRIFLWEATFSLFIFDVEIVWAPI
jgi:hypothetical protein